MKKILSISILLVAFGGLLAACGSNSSDDKVDVGDVWARVTAPGQENGAVYATLESSSDNKLTGASVPDDVAAKTELHETGEAEGSEMSGDDEMSGESKNATGHDGMEGESGSAMMSMSPVSSIDLPADEQVNLEPGRYHIMMFDLVKPIKDGESIPVTLSFESGDDQTVDATAREG
jgi:copper(I)-binding protein